MTGGGPEDVVHQYRPPLSNNLRNQRPMLATLVLTNNQLETWHHPSPRTTRGPRWKQPTQDLRSSNRKSERLIDSHRHSLCQLQYPKRVQTSTTRLHLTTREGLAGLLGHPKSTPHNADAKIPDVSHDGGVVGIPQCTRRPNSTSTAGQKKMVTTKTGAAAAASGADDENAS